MLYWVITVDLPKVELTAGDREGVFFMEAYFALMSEDYRAKHYPDGSVFSTIHKTSRKNGIGIYIFFAPFLALTAAGALFSAKQLMETVLAGEKDMISVGVFALCLCLVGFAACLLPVVLTKKRGALGAEGLAEKSAKNSACNESDIREFERQAMASDSCVLALTAKHKAALNGQRDGILTRDYVFLADNRYIVLKCSDIAGALLVERIIYVMTGNVNTPIHSLTISLVSHQNVQTFMDASAEAGTALISLLLERNPSIETMGGRVIQEKEWDRFCKERRAVRR